MKKKVIIALSGGVDSSVAAYLLKQAGYEITGIFLRLIPGQEKSEAAARAAARQLSIKFYPFSVQERFQREVIDYFLESYAAGLTPNPCIRCNKIIKFSILFELAGALGGNFVATGHYARCQKKKKSDKYRLYRARDKDKDQSYFLYTLTQSQLARILFPIGELTKEEVKAIAVKKGLPHLAAESQDVCFLAAGGKIIHHNEFLEKHLELKPGPIKKLNGETVGRHKGLPLYTVGQRKGVEIGGQGPFYVVRADYRRNILYVASNRSHPSLYCRKFRVNQVNWLSGQELIWPLKCLAAIRYRHKPAESTVKLWPGKKGIKRNIFSDCLTEFKDPQRAVTPGQSVVFYQDNEVLGGGIISLDRGEKVL